MEPGQKLTATQRRRLLKLRRHVAGLKGVGRMMRDGTKSFTLDRYLHTCGAPACLKGWVPVVFPRDWTYIYGDCPVLRKMVTNDNGYEVVDDSDEQAHLDYFGLNEPLFNPRLVQEKTDLLAKRTDRDIALLRIDAALARDRTGEEDFTYDELVAQLPVKRNR